MVKQTLIYLYRKSILSNERLVKKACQKPIRKWNKNMYDQQQRS
jgi:hypothetical protein